MLFVRFMFYRVGNIHSGRGGLVRGLKGPEEEKEGEREGGRFTTRIRRCHWWGRRGGWRGSRR